MVLGGGIECDRIVRREQTLVSRIPRMFRRALRITFQQVIFNFSIPLLNLVKSPHSRILKY